MSKAGIECHSMQDAHMKNIGMSFTLGAKLILASLILLSLLVSCHIY